MIRLAVRVGIQVGVPAVLIAVTVALLARFLAGLIARSHTTATDTVLQVLDQLSRPPDPHRYDPPEAPETAPIYKAPTDTVAAQPSPTQEPWWDPTDSLIPELGRDTAVIVPPGYDPLADLAAYDPPDIRAANGVRGHG